jgi:hypothetical protein
MLLLLFAGNQGLPVNQNDQPDYRRVRNLAGYPANYQPYPPTDNDDSGQVLAADEMAIRITLTGNDLRTYVYKVAKFTFAPGTRQAVANFLRLQGVKPGVYAMTVEIRMGGGSTINFDPQDFFTISVQEATPENFFDGRVIQVVNEP